jgi:hypothetical protein
VATPTAGWLTFGSQSRPGTDEKTQNGPTPLDASVLQAFAPPSGFSARAWTATRAGMAWLSGGWRPLVLGCVAGGLVVSVLWSLF